MPREVARASPPWSCSVVPSPAGSTIDAADEEPSTGDVGGPPIEAGVAMPAANPADTLSSTWYCAAGTATRGRLADHVVLIANPTDDDRAATRHRAARHRRAAARRGRRATRAATTTTTTAPPETTTTTAVEPPPGADRRGGPGPRAGIEVALRDLVDAPLAGAIVEVDGGEVSVEHQITGDGGRAPRPAARRPPTSGRSRGASPSGGAESCSCS